MSQPATQTPPQDDAPAPPASREQLRSRRPRDVRKRTIHPRRMTQRDREIGQALYPADELAANDAIRPRTRADCVDGERPCPFVSCKHHLYLDVKANGALELNFPDLEPDELGESCSLDMADRGGGTLQEVGSAMNLTRERIRQIEVKALAKGKASDEFAEERADREAALGSRPSKRRLPLLVEDEDDEEDFDPDHFASDALAE